MGLGGRDEEWRSDVLLIGNSDIMADYFGIFGYFGRDVKWNFSLLKGF